VNLSNISSLPHRAAGEATEALLVPSACQPARRATLRMRMSHKQNLPRRQGVHPQAAVFPAAPGANAHGGPANARGVQHADQPAARRGDAMRRWGTVALCHPCTTQQCRRGRAPHEAGPIRRLHGNEYAHGPRPDGDGRGCLRRAGDCGSVMSGSLAIAAAGPGGAPLLRPGFRGVAGEGGGGAFQQGPDRCCGHAVQDHLVEGGSHAVWGWPAGACQPAGWLVSLLGEADVRVEHGEQGAREAGGRPPRRDRHGLTTVPRVQETHPHPLGGTGPVPERAGPDHRGKPILMGIPGTFPSQPPLARAASCSWGEGGADVQHQLMGDGHAP
jgi:hypothetical protein